VYTNALTVELRHRGVSVERNVVFEVVYRGVPVGRYVADLVVDRKVIVESKVAKAIDPGHRAQVSNYLRASGLEVGLVMNFGSSVQFKRVVASSHRVRGATTDESRNDNAKTTPRQRQDLTRMNHDHDDDADLFRRHPTHVAAERSLVLNNRNERLPGERAHRCRRS